MPSSDSVVAGAEGHVLTHESEECSRRKQAKRDKPVSEELDSQTKSVPEPASDSESAIQDWQCPLLWAALGGSPDTDFVEGIAIVSHPNGPELAIAQVFQQMRTAQTTPDVAGVTNLREQSKHIDQVQSLKASDLYQSMEADQVSDLDDYIFPFVTSQFEADFTGEWWFALKDCWTDPSLLPDQK